MKLLMKPSHSVPAAVELSENYEMYVMQVMKLNKSAVGPL